MILRAFLLRRGTLTSAGSGLILVGSRFDADTRRLLQVLSRNRLSSRWIDLETAPEAEDFLRSLDVSVAELPLVVIPGGQLLRNPTQHALLAELASPASTSPTIPKASATCSSSAAGRAASRAAVYGASEGLSTTLIDSTAFGGQAGTSSRIENYLGFPAGLVGQRAHRPGNAAGAEVRGADAPGRDGRVVDHPENGRHRVDPRHRRVGHRQVDHHRHRRALQPASPSIGSVTSRASGIYYAATQLEAQSCVGRPVAIVGGGNSAGQAALFLARTCRAVS